MIRAAPALTVLLMIGPILAGLAGTLLPAFGFLPVLGGEELSSTPWRRLLAEPGLNSSVGLSYAVGLGAGAMSAMLAIGVVAACYSTGALSVIARLLSPLLSVPHVTLALGLAFLLAPSGWLVRLISPWVTGWDRPPDVLIVHDPYGLVLSLGLVIKETPFLVLMTLAALDQIDASRLHAVARSLGYRPMTAWFKVVLPRLYPRLRLPVLAVIAYGTGVVDMAVVLGPTAPAPLAVRVVDWMSDPDLARRFVGSAGAMLQMLVTAAALLSWWGIERGIARFGWRWIAGGASGGREDGLRWSLVGLVACLVVMAALALLGLMLWSVAGPWWFPDAWPAALSLDAWQRTGAELIKASRVTVIVAVLSAGAALLLVIGCLENETQAARRPPPWVDWILFTPLLVPQVAFLFGIQVLLVRIRLDGSWLALVWSHLVFVLPYVFLSLAGPWRRFDPRYPMVARSLGAGPNRVLTTVTLPLLLRPVLVALAVGIAVSVAQYLPTLFAGAGRLSTLTTEAVALSAGGDRRVIGAFGLLQMLLPLFAFILAQGIPPLVSRHFRHAAMPR